MRYREVKDDGTRVYQSWNTYRPKPVEDRLIGINKPEDPRAIRFHTRWFLPLELTDEEVRVMPQTLPDDLAYDHMEKLGGCRCEVCVRPAAERWKRKWRKHKGLRS